MEKSSRQGIINETIQALVELVLAQKLADMPDWIDFDLTVSQLRTIYLLAFRGPFTISELAKMLGVGNPAASILVQQLVQQGLVKRSEDQQDRRRTQVSLTAQGIELVSGRRDQREANARRWLNRLSDEELTDLQRGLAALANIVKSEKAEQSQKYERVISGID